MLHNPVIILPNSSSQIHSVYEMQRNTYSSTESPWNTYVDMFIQWYRPTSSTTSYHRRKLIVMWHVSETAHHNLIPALKFISVDIRNAPEIRSYTSSSSSTELRGIRTSTYSSLKAERNEKNSDGARMIRIRILLDLEISRERSFLRDRHHILLIVGEKKHGYLKLTKNPKKSAARRRKEKMTTKKKRTKGFMMMMNLPIAWGCELMIQLLLLLLLLLLWRSSTIFLL